MKKVSISLIAGILLGIIVTALFFDYETPWTTYTYSGTDSLSEPTIIKAIDIDFLFYMTIFSLVGAILVYLVWTYAENKRHEKFLAEYHKGKESRRNQ